VLRRTAYVLELVSVGELMLLKQTVDMQLCELESTFIHALFLHIVDISRVRHVEKLVFNLLNREWSKLL
jgi:hypothetical protein